MKHNNINDPDKTLKSVAARIKREYQKYEFCKAVNCSCYTPGAKDLQVLPNCITSDCVMTAKEFHHWLMDNWFKIIKENENG